jgi:hypothetical protein
VKEVKAVIQVSNVGYINDTINLWTIRVRSLIEMYYSVKVLFLVAGSCSKDKLI